MTHDEILTLLYEETLVGNAPAVKDGVEHGSRVRRHGPGAGCSTTR